MQECGGYELYRDRIYFVYTNKLRAANRLAEQGWTLRDIAIELSYKTEKDVRMALRYYRKTSRYEAMEAKYHEACHKSEAVLTRLDFSELI